jgi:hypothetical protein
MFETIAIFQYNNGLLHRRVKSSITVALLATLFSSPILAVGADTPDRADTAKTFTAPPKDPFKPEDIVNALTAPPNVPQASQNLASSFLDHTLPRLLTDDERLAQQLGFGDSMGNPVTIDRAFSIMVIRRADLLEVVGGKRKPVDLVNNINNWRQEDDRLIPRRIIFLLKAKNSTPEPNAYSWSSLTLEQSREGSWRILQVGAPKLSRAMSQHGKQETHYFLLWLPDLNRHYLGRLSAADDARNPKILLTALFDDRLIRVKDADVYRTRKAGEEFEASSQDFFKRLRDLYEDLDLPKKLRRKSDQGGEQPAQAQ